MKKTGDQVGGGGGEREFRGIYGKKNTRVKGGREDEGGGGGIGYTSFDDAFLFSKQTPGGAGCMYIRAGPLRRPVCFEDSYKCAYTNWRVRVKVGFVAVYGPFVCLRWNRVRQERRGGPCTGVENFFAIGIRKRVYRVQ